MISRSETHPGGCSALLEVSVATGVGLLAGGCFSACVGTGSAAGTALDPFVAAGTFDSCAGCGPCATLGTGLTAAGNTGLFAAGDTGLLTEGDTGLPAVGRDGRKATTAANNPNNTTSTPETAARFPNAGPVRKAILYGPAVRFRATLDSGGGGKFTTTDRAGTRSSTTERWSA